MLKVFFAVTEHARWQVKVVKHALEVPTAQGGLSPRNVFSVDRSYSLSWANLKSMTDVCINQSQGGKSQL